MKQNSLSLWEAAPIRRSRQHRFLYLVMVALLLGLGACSGGGTSTTENAAQGATAENSNGSAGQFGTPFESTYLQTAYENALPTTTQLMLGTLELEAGEHALTAEQATKLLPLWQGLQGGSITNATERNAVYKSIEQTMDAAQLEEIAAMALTFADMTEWMSAHGIEMPQGGQFGQRGQNGATDGNNPFAALTDEQRAELRNLSPEERQARLRELGIELPQGGFGGGAAGNQSRGQAGAGAAGGQGLRGGRFNVLMTPLIDLLTARAAATE